MKFVHAVLLTRLYLEAHPDCAPVDIVRDVFRAQRGENSKCRHAYLTLRKMCARKLVVLRYRK